MDTGKEWECQVKEKCGNRIVNIILERIQVSGQYVMKSHKNSSSLKIRLGNQDGSLGDAGPSSESGTSSDPGPSRPQRNKTKNCTQFFDEGSDNSDIESDASGSDSEPNDTSDCASKPSPQIKCKRKTKNSKKPSTRLDREDEANRKTNHSSNSKKLKKGGKSRPKIACSICNLIISKDQISRHLKRKHPETIKLPTILKEKSKNLKTEKSDPKIACSICNVSVITKSHMRRHIRRKHPEVKLPTTTPEYKLPRITCDFCSVSVAKVYIRQHMQIKHQAQLSEEDLPREIKCDECPLVLPLGKLYVHKKTQHKSKTQLQCDLCSYKCMTPLGLENHILQVHVVDKPFECDICFKSFLTENMRHLHVKRDHEVENLSCRYCHTKSFKDSASLNKHIQAAHKGYKEHCDSEASGSNLMCPVCDTWFLSDADLAEHLKMPKSESILECEICSEPVHTPCLLNLHRQKVHSENPKVVDDSRKRNQLLEGVVESADAMQGPHSEKITEIFAPSATNQDSSNSNTFSCVVCSAIFTRRCDLELHELQEKHRRWKCPICGKLISWKKDLKIHIQSVHSDAKPFHCTHEGCSKSFKTKKELRNHMSRHDCLETGSSGLYHIKCDICSKMFGSSLNLKQHLRTHTDERPFPCKFCVARYKCTGEANRHMKKCQDRSEDQRKEFTRLSNTNLRSAEKLKSKKIISCSSKQSTDKAVQLHKKALTLKPKSHGTINKLTCATTGCNGNGTDLTLVKREVDVKVFGDNSIIYELPVREGSVAKLETVPKQELCTDLPD